MNTLLVPSILLYKLRLNTALSYSALVDLGSDVLDIFILSLLDSIALSLGHV